jgi:ubiquinone/menaquinone biosynthesis C-methylase UbiE
MELKEYNLMYELENTHWWFLGKRKFISTIFPKVKKVKILDIGAGTGGTTKFLKTYGEVVGLEANPLAQTLARKRGLKIVSGSAEKLPFEKETFEVVTIFDVLYHQNIGSDLKVLQEAHRVLRTQGYLVVTDCALPFLKSPHDEVMQARERYTKKELTQKIEKAGFKVEKASYVFFLVFPLTLCFPSSKIIKQLSSGNLYFGGLVLEIWYFAMGFFPYY